MTKIKFLLFSIAMVLSITSCIEDKPLENDKPLNPESLLSMQQAFATASGGSTPMKMGKNEWAYFRLQAKLYTGQFQGLGYQTAQVLTASNDQIHLEDQSYRTRNLNVLVTDYKEPVNGNDPEIDIQKEWACKFVVPPYYLWYGECDLPPEQNFWLFNALDEPSEAIFYSLAKYTQREKLPQKMIDEGRCYNYVNCEIEVNYLEYDMWGKDTSGVYKRIHYISAFSPETPYLASNIKTCYSTLIDVEGKYHPAEICKELVDFQRGEQPPEECPADPDQPCDP